MAETILFIGLIVFLAHYFVALFQKTRVPDVLLLTLLGLILGPITHEVTPEAFGKAGGVISTIALVLILFESGVTLDPTVLPRVWSSTLRLTLSTMVITFAIVLAVGIYALQLPPLTAAMMAAALGGTSAAVVIALVKSMKMSDPGGTILILESALGDVLTIILLLGLMESARSGQLEPAKIIGSIFASLLCAGLIGVAGGIAWLTLMNTVRSAPNTAFTTLAFVFVLYGLTDILGFSGAIAALAFGATLSNHPRMGLDRIPFLRGRKLGELAHFDHVFLNELLFLLKVFFFIYLGVSIRFTEVWLALVALGAVAAIYLVRLFTVRLISARSAIPWQDASLMSTLAPKGLVSAVLVSIPVAANIAGAERARDFTYFVVVISIIVTAVLIPLTTGPFSGLYRRLYKTPTASDSQP
ncbi:MAG: cation:proton antiporter [Bryobacteraceae bacterium]